MSNRDEEVQRSRDQSRSILASRPFAQGGANRREGANLPSPPADPLPPPESRVDRGRRLVAEQEKRFQQEREQDQRKQQREQDRRRDRDIAHAHAAQNPLIAEVNERVDALEVSTLDLATGTRKFSDHVNAGFDAMEDQLAKLKRANTVLEKELMQARREISDLSGALKTRDLDTERRLSCLQVAISDAVVAIAQLRGSSAAPKSLRELRSDALWDANFRDIG
jgi:hypothetical protein